MTRPLITVAPTGARRTKADHPALPITVEEIAADAAKCQAAGADALHLHVRDAEGRHTLDAGLYAEAIAAVDSTAPGLAIQITTEAAGRFQPAAQLRYIEAVRPRDASAAVREVMADADIAARFYGFAAEADVSLQHILFDDADAARCPQEGVPPEVALEEITQLQADDAPIHKELARGLEPARPRARLLRFAFCVAHSVSSRRM